VNYYIAPSKFMAAKLRAHGWPSHRVCHVPYCVDMQTPHRRVDEGKYFLFVGKLETLKGIDVLLSAAASVPNAEIRLAGSCDDPAVRARLATCPPNVSYLGTKNADEVRSLMANARAVLVPSIWYDNQPFVILEAFTVAAPVIGTRIGGIPELLEGGERGLLVDPGSVEQLADAISALEKKPQQSIAMGRAARTYVERQHSARAHLASLSEIYRRAINAKEHPVMVDKYSVTPKWI
jgi:glycosyltransferase involved in cell wall biosynthesis